MTTRYGAYKPTGPSPQDISSDTPPPQAAGDLTAAQTSAAAALVGGSARLSPAGEGGTQGGGEGGHSMGNVT